MQLIYLSGFLAFLKTAVFLIGYISNNSLFPEPLSPEEEAKVLKRYMDGDEEARNILIERNLRLVAHICKKYNIPNVDNDDLISIGSIGLIKGINTFNMNKGVKLSTYIARCAENEILMFLRASKKIGAETYLNEPIGKDKDDNEIALIDILENDEKSIEDEIDLSIKIKKLMKRMQDILKGREKTIIELRYGLNRTQTKNSKSNCSGFAEYREAMYQE